MSGSNHFQIYEHNLRRILLLDWLRDEQMRRSAAALVAGTRGMPHPAATPVAAQPYWLRLAASH